MQMAVATTKSGALQPVPGAHSKSGESVGWAQWLPGGHTLIASRNQDINFPAVALPSPH
jgi:hypothetical protein